MDGYSEADEYMVIAHYFGDDEIWSEKVKCSSNMKPIQPLPNYGFVFVTDVR